MKVLYLTNLASPYRVDFFNELSKYCDLTVLFERKKAADRDDEWYSNNYKFKAIFLNSKNIYRYTKEKTLNVKLAQIVFSKTGKIKY